MTLMYPNELFTLIVLESRPTSLNMKRLTLLLGFLLFFSLVSIADSWTDPEWEGNAG